MKDSEALARLRDLRLLREQRAREGVVRQKQSVLGAAERVHESVEAIAHELRQAEVEEENTFGPLAGSVVSTGSLHEVQHRFDVAAAWLRNLEAQEAEAKDLEQKSRNELTAAHETHRVHRLKLEKLESVIEQRSFRERGRRAAHAELSDEEQVNSSEASHRGVGI